MITIRTGTVEDCSDALHILKTAFSSHLALQPPSGVTRETVETLEERLKTDTMLFAIDSESKRPVGCLFFAPPADEPGTLYLGRLGVLPEYRKQGIASRLIGEVERYAAEHGYQRVTLGVRIVLKDNLRLFQSLGYAIYAEHAHGDFSTPTYYSLAKSINGE